MDILLLIVVVVAVGFAFVDYCRKSDEHQMKEEQKRNYIEAENKRFEERKAINELNAKFPPLKDGSLLRATIDPILPTALQVTVQLSNQARQTLDKGKLWDYSLGEIHNWLYNYEVQKYNEAWLRYDIHEKNKTEHTRHRIEKPTLPQPKKTRPVLIQDLCNPRGYTCYFDTASEAKAGAEQLRKMLELLKSFIEENKSPPQKQTFDL